jgi:hypothetical protein
MNRFNNRSIDETGRIKFSPAMPLMSDKVQAKICCPALTGRKAFEKNNTTPVV